MALRTAAARSSRSMEPEVSRSTVRRRGWAALRPVAGTRMAIRTRLRCCITGSADCSVRHEIFSAIDGSGSP